MEDAGVADEPEMKPTIPGIVISTEAKAWSIAEWFCGVEKSYEWVKEFPSRRRGMPPKTCPWRGYLLREQLHEYRNRGLKVKKK
jgi:hypothetical protein